MGNGFLLWQGGGGSTLPLTETTEYELLADIEVTGSATTNVYINGLSIGKGDEVVLVSTINNTADIIYKMYFNDNITDANYYSQRINADSTTVSCARYNYPMLSDSGASGNGVCVIANIKLTNNGYGVFQAKSERRHGGSSVTLSDSYATTTYTTSAINSITVSASSASGLTVGSRFQLYKATGEVTQTWVTT